PYTTLFRSIERAPRGVVEWHRIGTRHIAKMESPPVIEALRLTLGEECQEQREHGLASEVEIRREDQHQHDGGSHYVAARPARARLLLLLRRHRRVRQDDASPGRRRRAQ